MKPTIVAEQEAAPDTTDVASGDQEPTAALEPPLAEAPVGEPPVAEPDTAAPVPDETAATAPAPDETAATVPAPDEPATVPVVSPWFDTEPVVDGSETTDLPEAPTEDEIETVDTAVPDGAEDTHRFDEPIGPDSDLDAGEIPTPGPALVAEREPSPGEKTSEMVGQLWTASPPEGPIEGWEPDDIDRAMSSTRSFRWTSVIAILAIAALVAVGLVLLPSITRNRANAHREMMREALHELRDELPDAQTSLQVATEPTSTVTALNDLSTELTALSAKATAVDNAGRKPLPGTLPLTSSEPIDELAIISQRLEPLAATALTIQRRIANLVEYRTLMDGFLTLPDLPTTADESEQADLRVTLASTQAESASILSDLPEDVSLSEHRDLAKEVNEMFATWQVDYLEALRTRDDLAAEALINDLQFQLDQLDAALVAPLAQIRRQTDADIIDLAATIDEVDTIAAEQA